MVSSPTAFVYPLNEYMYHQAVRSFGNTALSLPTNAFFYWSRTVYTWLAVEERVPMVWPITGINKRNVSCVTCFENKVYKTKKNLN